MKLLTNHLTSVALVALLALPGAALAQSSQSPAAQPTTPPPPAGAASPMTSHPVAGKTAEERVERYIKRAACPVAHHPGRGDPMEPVC